VTPVALRRGATPRARGLLLLALLALLVGLATGVPALVVAGAVLVVPLLLPLGATEPRRVAITQRGDGAAVLAGESTALELTIRLDAPAEHLRARVEGSPGLRIDPARAAATGTTTLRLTVQLTPQRWGPLPDPRLTVDVGSCRGLRAGRVTVTLPVGLLALPRPRDVRSGARGMLGRVRTGDHPRRRPGSGTEFHGLRPYQPGDRLRDVHWAASSRRDEPYVVERDIDAAVDVVLLVDVLARTDDALAANALGVEGAVSLARALCNGADRTGLIGLGATIAMTPPGTGLRHWYRLARTAATLQSRESYVTPDLARIPPAVLPRSALVVVFTPLADARIRPVLADLRRRRYAVVVIDTSPVLRRPAEVDRLDDLTLRLAALERSARHADLGRLGCRVADWDGTGPLEEILDRATLVRSR
jgi:uncharacterized protein (DUF58 family)